MSEPEPAPVEESVIAAVEGLLSGESGETYEAAAVEEPALEPAMAEEPAITEEPEAAEERLPEEVDITIDTESDENKETEKMSAENIEEVALPDLEDGPEADESGCVTAGMTISGDITSEGSLEVIGVVRGNINVRGKLNVSGSINGNSKASEVFADSAKITGEVISKGAVKVGQESVIIGNITATSAVIAGAVKGDIDVRGPVILDTSAIVMGDIKSKSVQINNGAVVEGHCSQCYAEVSPTSFFDELKNSVKG
ncbi:MAG: polymer-forming cytoskeletal protein [Lachnospiraceae bacterium]|nr:polymer-forming cytoskeletal protein [Lachnospiraceae bacterium]